MRTLLKLTLAAMLAATLAFAQRGGGSKGGGDTMGPMTPGTVNRFDEISNLLKLNKDQKKLLRSTMDDAQKEAAPLRDQMLKSRTDIGDAVAGGKPQAEIDQAANAFAALESKMAAIEFSAFAKLYNSLDKDQQASTGMSPVFVMMHGLFKNKNWTDVK